MIGIISLAIENPTLGQVRASHELSQRGILVSASGVRSIFFIPKCRKKTLYGKVRRYLGNVFHEFASQQGIEIIEGHMV